MKTIIFLLTFAALVSCEKVETVYITEEPPRDSCMECFNEGWIRQQGVWNCVSITPRGVYCLPELDTIDGWRHNEQYHNDVLICYNVYRCKKMLK